MKREFFMTKRMTALEPISKSVQCGFCGKLFEYKLYPEITIPGDHKLKKQVLNKTLFVPRCPYCKQQIKVKPECIYRNKTKNEIFVVTDTLIDHFEDMLITGDILFSDIASDEDIEKLVIGMYKRRIVRDIDSFREKILLSDNNYDDRIFELMKLSLSRLIERKTHSKVYRIFLDDTSGHNLLFTAITGERPPFEYISINSNPGVYVKYRKKYLDRLGLPNEDEYIFTDQNWAKESGLLEDDDESLIEM